MANLKASIKDIKKSRKRREGNLTLKNTMKKAIREMKDAISSGAEKAKIDELIIKTTKAIDKTAKAGVIHRNNAARKKSKLSKLLVVKK